MPQSEGGERGATAVVPRRRPEGMRASENQTSHMGKPGRGTGGKGRDTHSETPRHGHISMSSHGGAKALGYIKLKDTLLFAYFKICGNT